jgi:hypothetical protein
MKSWNSDIKSAEQYFKYALDTKPLHTYVVEWKDVETGETYNLSGHGGRTKSRQLLSYIKLLRDKHKMVRANQTHTPEFFRLIMNQNGGNRGERVSGFAGHFPNGSEMSLTLSIAEFQPNELAKAKQLNSTLKKTFKKVCRVDLNFKKDQARAVTLKQLNEDVIVDADTARSVRYFRAVA